MTAPKPDLATKSPANPDAPVFRALARHKLRPPTGGPDAVTAAFNPDQPRDPDGKFAATGGESDDNKQQTTTHDSVIGTPAYQFAVDDWLGGTGFAEEERDHPGSGYPEGGPISDKVDPSSIDVLQQAIEKDGSALVDTAYRGISVDSEALSQMQPGATINLPPSSFAPDPGNAVAYADTGLGDHPVILEMPAGVRAIDISDRSMDVWGEPEAITSGRFVVDSVRTYGSPDAYLTGAKPTTGDGGLYVVKLKPGG